ncbi:MAG: multidrug DMT transporter permease [Verrucomicrobiaceae bacterium]|nr:multidrug DMT transporter permease [Verrucomicrobiaceae bacterium]
MLTVTSQMVAIVLCVVTMICWGSWGNTQKLASKEWKFQLFYWDYVIGILAFSLFMALTAGSMGEGGRSFINDICQADPKWLAYPIISGIIFNLSNILLVIAIDIAGLAVAFPVGIGLALVLGVITTYFARPEGNPYLLALGVGLIVVAIILDALAFKRIGSRGATVKGIVVSVMAGILMGFFFSFIAEAMGKIEIKDNVAVLEATKLSPYSAMVLFAVGILVSNFVFNTLAMKFPIDGSQPVPVSDYFKKGTPRLHLIGILGGSIWCLGTLLSFVSASAVPPALSYALGQGATMVSALWGVFIWKEFKNAPSGTNVLLAFMFIFFIVGLGILVFAK